MGKKYKEQKVSDLTVSELSALIQHEIAHALEQEKRANWRDTLKEHMPNHTDKTYPWDYRRLNAILGRFPDGVIPEHIAPMQIAAAYADECKLPIHEAVKHIQPEDIAIPHPDGWCLSYWMDDLVVHKKSLEENFAREMREYIAGFQA